MELATVRLWKNIEQGTYFILETNFYENSINFIRLF